MRYFVLATGVLFVGAGIYLLWKGDNSAVAWNTIMFFGACALIAAWDFVAPRIKEARYASFVHRAVQRRTLIVKSDASHFIVYGLGSAGFVFAGVAMITMGAPRWLGLLTVGFFGLGALVCLWHLVDRRPRLIIDSDGVIDRTSGVGRIVWEDIESAHLHSVAGNDFIGLVLRDPQFYLEQMPWFTRKLANANSAMGFGTVNLNLSGITVSSQEVLEMVTRYLRESQRIGTNKTHND